MPFAHTHAPKRDTVTTGSSVLFHSYTTLVRLRCYSDSLSFLNFKRPSLPQSRLNALHSRRSYYANPDPYTVIIHCVICFLRNNLPRWVLPSQPTFYTVQATFAFTFPIVFNTVVFRCVIRHARHECVPWSPNSPRYFARTWRISSRPLYQPVWSSFNFYL